MFMAEPYIERCCRSLFGQTLKELELIFIDDCSRDRSMEVVENVLADYPGRKSCVKILHNEKNMGVSHTRQRGVDAATGEYIAHCDPDDWVEPDAYEKLYAKAEQTGADIVICDYHVTSSPEPVKVSLPVGREALFEAIVFGKFDNYLWNKILRREFIQASGIKFNPSLSLWEDQAYLVPLMLMADCVSMVHEPLYHYFSDNIRSISRGKNLKKALSRIGAVADVEKFLQKRGWAEDYAFSLAYWKSEVKYDLLRFDPGKSAGLWRNTFPEVNGMIWKFPMPLSHKILCFMARLRLGFLVKAVQRPLPE